MNCKDFESIVLELDKEERVNSPALEHAQGCARCSAQLEAIQELGASLRAVARQDQLMEAPAHIEAALLKTLRGSREPLSTGSSPIPIITPPRFRLVLAAAAAMILIAIAASVIHTRSESKGPMQAGGDRGQATPTIPDQGVPKPSVPQSVPKEGSVPPNQNGAEPPDEAHRPGDNQLAKGRGPTRSRPVKVQGVRPDDRIDNYEIATDYFPISSGSYLQPFDGGRVVRIRLPRSALMNYGLPVDPLRADEAVKADVVIGNDGMARAIRFVH